MDIKHKDLNFSEDPTTHCPHCGRYVGPLEICSYCRKYIRKRTSILVIKYGSVLLSFVGLLVLYTYGANKENPLTKIADLGETSNFAYVKVQGKLSELPSGYKDANNQFSALQFVIDDGSETLSVKVFADALKELVKKNNLPFLFDQVTVQGSFQKRGDARSIILNSSSQLKITPRGDCQEVPMDILGDAAENQSNQCFIVKGKITEIEDLDYSYLLMLKDSEGHEVGVNFMKDYTALMKMSLPTQKIGEEITLQGIVKKTRRNQKEIVELLPFKSL